MAWSQRDLRRLAESNPRIADQLRAQGVDLQPTKGRDPAITILLTPRPTNTALLVFGLFVTGTGHLLRWIGDGLIKAGRAIRRHAFHKDEANQ